MDSTSADAPLNGETLQHIREQALAQLRSGDRLSAEETVHAAVVKTAAEAGTSSPLYAKALFQEAAVLAALGDLSRAAVACRAAATVQATDAQSQRDRLTYLMNLGEMLTRLGELDEAEQVLRVSLDARRQFYGPEHPGFAFGLSGLAELLLVRNQPLEALELIDAAVAINRKVGHEQLPHDLGLRAFIIKSTNTPDVAFSDWEALPAAARDRLVKYCLGRAQAAENASEAGVALEVLQELRQRLQPAAESEPIVFLNTLIAIANAARLTGDHETRIQASRLIVASCQHRGDRRYLVQAGQGLAHALGEAGRVSEAEAAYELALGTARQLGDEALAANVLRNHAILLDEHGQNTRAETLHRQAVQSAAASGDPIMQGRTLGAFGIFLQHAGNLAQAVPMLDRATELLPPSDPDAFYVHNHREALRAGQGCGCGDGGPALAVVLQRLIEPHLPAGLLKRVSIKLRGDEPPDIGVELARPATAEESELLHRVASHALAELRQQHRQAGYSR